MSWTSNDPSMRATKSTAQYAREQEMNERIMAQKSVTDMTAEELVKAIDPSVAMARALQSTLKWCPECHGKGWVWARFPPDGEVDKDECGTCEQAQIALWDYDHRNDGK